MPSALSPDKLSIAIIGAGIGGLTAAIALQKLQDERISFHLYEQAKELQEIGASIALGPNGLRTLEKLGVHNALDDDIAFRNPSKLPMIYRHWKTNEIVSFDEHHNVTEHLHRTARYHRAHLHSALLANVPRESISLEKKLRNVVVDDDGVEVFFEDGTSARADVVLGADGIRSSVRKAFVPDFKLNWSGWVAFRSVFDVSLVKDIPDLPYEATHWWGEDRTLFASRLGKGLFTVVGGSTADPDDPNASYKDATWDQEGDISTLQTFYSDWHPAIKALVDSTPSTRLYPNFSGSALDTWVLEGRVTVLGDAAHAHGGAYAAGGSLAIDDAYAFSLAIKELLRSHSLSPPRENGVNLNQDVIKNALFLYEATRKPHTDRLLKTVHGINARKLTHRREKGERETDQELRARMIGRADPVWLHEHDVEKAFSNAKELTLK